MSAPRGVWAVALVWGATWCGSVPAEEPRVERTVQELIRQLASEDFDTREAAATELGKRSDAFVPLHCALRSPDAEVVKRAQATIDQLKPAYRKQALKRFRETLVRGEVDLFVDRFVHLREDLSADDWAFLPVFAEKVRFLACEKNVISIPALNFPFQEYPSILTDVSRSDMRLFGQYRIAADKVSVESDLATTFSSVIACRGPVSSNWSLQQNVIFANGNVSTKSNHTFSSIKQCIIICDGDIETCGATNSVLIASGAVKIRGASPNCVIIQKEANPLKCIKRFEVSSVGIDVKEAKPGVEVLGVVDGKPFAAAGLVKGDRVLEVQGAKINTAEEFRRVVRRYCVDDVITRVKIRRDGVDLEILVHLIY